MVTENNSEECLVNLICEGSMEFLKIYSDMQQFFEPYDMDEIGILFCCMMNYAFHGEEPNFNDMCNERFIWPVLKRHIDQCAAATEKNATNGAKGGRPKNPTKPNETQQNPDKPNETQANPTEPNKTLQEQEQEHIQEQDKKKSVKEKRSQRSRFTPPTVEEVRAYCQERGNNVDPQKFVDYYESVGWMVGNKKPMKDFKAGVRTWERNDFSGGNRDSPSDNGVLRQRNYDADYFASLEVDLTK